MINRTFRFSYGGRVTEYTPEPAVPSWPHKPSGTSIYMVESRVRRAWLRLAAWLTR